LGIGGNSTRPRNILLFNDIVLAFSLVSPIDAVNRVEESLEDAPWASSGFISAGRDNWTWKSALHMEHESSSARFWVTIKSLEIALTLRQFGHSILIGTFFIDLLW
jgi:hypothetical protein